MIIHPWPQAIRKCDLAKGLFFNEPRVYCPDDNTFFRRLGGRFDYIQGLARADEHSSQLAFERERIDHRDAMQALIMEGRRTRSAP